MYKLVVLSSVFLTITSCKTNESESTQPTNEVSVTRSTDHHSYARIHEAKTTHIHLDINVDFEKKEISGVASHLIEQLKKVDSIVFDVKNLIIDKVTLGKDGNQATTFKLGTYDSLLGQPLIVYINQQTDFVNIHYKTSNQADAIDWLAPNLTAGKKHPFLYTQGQAILTRSWIPIQDTPANRITYTAKVTVPSHLLPLMSAENPQEKNTEGVYHFKMEQSIPSYLIALAVGNLEYKALSDNSGVYAEPELLDAAVYEFADMPKMIEVAESLYGEYRWEQYDVLVLPPAFPFGGMENPRLTFATPTILAGDRSLVSLIAHELAHSWSGNLVTNATWDDFWLNEGFTVYFESRIMEAVSGKEVSDMLTLIEYQELLLENDEINDGDHPMDTHLKLELEGRSPDDGMTSIAYVKGAFFLMTLEDAVGRDKFDAFVRNYFQHHAFQTLTTEQFVEYLNANLLQPNAIEFNTNEWIYQPGIPSNCRKITSTRFDIVDQLATEFLNNRSASDLGIKRSDWTTQEWMNFIRQLPADISPARLRELDKVFDFKGWGNSEIMTEWFVKGIQAGYRDIRPEMKSFLLRVGRRKFIEPIYSALAKTPEDKKWAQDVYKTARNNYHSVSFTTIDQIILK
jgi:leukotriene-A4 hydrolase